MKHNIKALTAITSFISLSAFSANLDKPNILVILVDDAGYSSFGFTGNKDVETPNIDNLASKGTIFTDAHVMGSVSAPSRAMLVTGRYGQRFGFECNLDEPDAGLSLEEETLGDIFKRAGYATAAIGKWHLGNLPQFHPNKRGFEHFFGFIEGSRSYFYNPNGADKPGDNHALQFNGKQIPFDGYLTDVLTDNACSFITQNKQKPFMMYLAYNAVHTPLQATKEDLARFKGKKNQKIAAMTYALDRGVGKVVETLKKNNLYENTLIFFLSDNGGATNNLESNLPYKGFKGNKFEGGHRIPFFCVWKNKIKENKKYNKLISSFDMLATAAHAANINTETLKNRLDGVNLLDYLDCKANKVPHKALFWRKITARAVRTNAYKWIKVENVGEVLYDMINDPYETNNIINDKPHIAHKMNHLWGKWNSNMKERAWGEGQRWPEVTDSIHSALMKNEKPTILYPGHLKKKVQK